MTVADGTGGTDALGAFLADIGVDVFIRLYVRAPNRMIKKIGKINISVTVLFITCLLQRS
jgi:hypothetical protein